MKKSFLVLLGVLAASFGRAVVLSWQVDLETANNNYAYAVLYAVNPAAGESGTPKAVVGIAMENGKSTAFDPHTVVDAYEGYNFYVQMAGANQQMLPDVVSETKSWSDLQGMGAISGIAPLSPWTGIWRITAVPEPAAVLLFGLGAAALALRRRRRS